MEIGSNAKEPTRLVSYQIRWAHGFHGRKGMGSKTEYVRDMCNGRKRVIIKTWKYRSQIFGFPHPELLMLVSAVTGAAELSGWVICDLLRR